MSLARHALLLSAAGAAGAPHGREILKLPWQAKFARRRPCGLFWPKLPVEMDGTSSLRIADRTVQIVVQLGWADLVPEKHERAGLIPTLTDASARAPKQPRIEGVWPLIA